MCGKKLTGGGPCPTCGAQTKALIPPPVLLPPRNRISRAGALILLVFVGAYIELGLLVGQGFVEPPTTQLMYVSSLIFPLIVLIAILWAILSLE